MKTFIKAIFIIIFPLLLIACVVTARGRHVSIRETYYYTLNTFNESVTTFVIDMESTKEVFSNLDWDLPSEYKVNLEDNDNFQTKVEKFLLGLSNTMKYIGTLISNVFVGLIHILGSLTRIVVFLLQFIINSTKVVLYFFGLIQ